MAGENVEALKKVADLIAWHGRDKNYLHSPPTLPRKTRAQRQ
jgi:hypothetical protein